MTRRPLQGPTPLATPLARRGATALAAVLLGATAACAGPGPWSADGRSERPAPAAAGGAAPARGFTLVVGGGVLPHDAVVRQARARGDGYDFRPVLAGVRPVVSAADLAICQLETVFGTVEEQGGDERGRSAVTSPPELAKNLAAIGYDACSTASDHALADGAAGVERTLDALDTAGIGHTGTARTAAEAREPAWLKAGGARVAQLAYTYGLDGDRHPGAQPWAVALIDEERIVADARAARKAGADVVLVSLHWGTAWQTAPDERQLALADALTASKTAGRPDIDLIVGAHAHVPQPYEKVNGTWVVYGTGDQLAGAGAGAGAGPGPGRDRQRDPRANQATLGRFTFAPPARPGERWEVAKAEFVPQWTDAAGRVVNTADASSKDADRHDREQAKDAVSAAVFSRGAAEHGLTMGR
ncbi:CapA family protein [Streptomyces sp. NBC_00306]|uniref:CapA family protein n=1 Tax=Streptomyces sp. NBC_00306 TaxID=2975708 RepID=UPI002E27B131|nr:CapA family protein [Streptomyces sp. NBC_00306]